MGPAEGGRRGVRAVRWRTSTMVWVAMAGMLLPGAAVAQATADTPPPAAGTRAVRGLAWGAAAGGVLGGLGLGTLAWGLCDSGDCEGSFGDGFVVGLLGGAAVGGLAGLVAGSAFPAGGPAAGGWSWRGWVGPRWTTGRDLDGTGVAAGVGLFHATTDWTRFGVAAEYLGTAESRRTFTFGTRDGGVGQGTSLRDWRIFSVRLVAVRHLGPEPGTGPAILGGVGVYPTVEGWDSFRTPPGPGPDLGRRTELVPAPGVGVGAVWALPLAGRWRVELGARGDVLAGVGSDDLLGLFQATVGVARVRVEG